MKRREFFSRLLAAVTGLIWKGPAVAEPVNLYPRWRNYTAGYCPAVSHAELIAMWQAYAKIDLSPLLLESGVPPDTPDEVDRLVRAEIKKLGKPSFTPLMPSTLTPVKVDAKEKESP